MPPTIPWAFQNIKNRKKNLKNKAKTLVLRARIALDNKKAEGYVDTGLKILIAVVIGALLLAGLYTLFDDTIMPTLTEKVKELFNYGG